MPRSPLLSGAGVAREVRLDDIVADTMNGYRGTATGTQPKFQELEMRQQDVGLKQAPSGQRVVPKRTDKVKQLTDGVKRSTNVSNNTRMDLQPAAVPAHPGSRLIRTPLKSLNERVSNIQQDNSVTLTGSDIGK